MLVSAADLNLELLQSLLVLFKSKKFSSHQRSCILFFAEKSTRTAISFELACSMCGIKCTSLFQESSSTSKGESIQNTARTLLASTPSFLVVRSPHNFDPFEISNFKEASQTCVINAGDGKNEHPTQALTDLFSILEAKNISTLSQNSLSSMKVLICGDILHSRVARSNIILLSKLGAKIILVAPPAFLPESVLNFYQQQYGVLVAKSLFDEASECDVVMLLRVQSERIKSFGGGVSLKNYSLNNENVKLLSDKTLIMHPGPFNDEVEITSEIAYNHKNSIIQKQVENGIFVRASILSHFCSI